MNRYRLTGNYGTFEIQCEVEVENFEAAYERTGVMSTLQDVGWEITDWPDGESWRIEIWAGDEWVEIEDDYYAMTCDGCGRVGNIDDAIEIGGPCQYADDEDPEQRCAGTIRIVKEG